MNIAPGVRLGPYEILAAIGAGGMGEVYRARDTRLDRTVAIKVLPAALAQSAQLRLRFEREAKAISALAHPNICTLHDVGSHDGIDYLVLEHLEGESLADRLAKGPLPVGETLRYAIEIADALDRAHRNGIVHRDLKPGNVMITRAGAKLLDFGLARSLDAQPISADSPTVAHKPLTEEGVIVGTVQYMAPEQLESRPADARTDIFAFGALLYEMLTGKRAFGGKSRASVIASILAAEPQPLSAVQPPAPAPLERVIRICLEKDPEDRWQCAHDLKLELQGVAMATVPPAARTKPGIAGWIAAALVLVAATSWFVFDRRTNHAAPGTLRFEIAPPANGRFNATDGPVAVSPDGLRLILRIEDPEREMFYVRSLASTTFEPLRGTERAFDAFWSSDGKQIGFFVDGKMKRLELGSSTIATICSAGDARGATWAGDTILFAPSALSPIMKVSASGGTPQPATKLDPSRKETGHWRPVFLPDGRRFLFVVRSAEEDKSGVYLGSLESSEVRRVLEIATTTLYAGTGHLLYTNDGNLYSQPFDPGKAKTTGPATVVAQNVSYSEQFGSPGYSTGGGVLAWNVRSVAVRSPIERMTLTGTVTSLGSEGANLDLSRDGTRLAFQRTTRGTRNQDIWTMDLRRGVATRITYESSEDIGPVWSPDGKRVAYATNAPDGARARIRFSSGTGGEETLLQRLLGVEVVDWSRDGRTLILEVGTETNRGDLATFDLATRKVTPFVSTPFQEDSGRFSPDGRWIAYQSDESGRMEISVQPFPPDGSRVQISTGGGESPRWTGDGRTLFYVARDRTLTSVPLIFGAQGVEAGPPRRHTRLGSLDYVMMPDGQSAIVSPLEAGAPQLVVVVANSRKQTP